MSTFFDPTRGLIIVGVRLYGPNGDRLVSLALDTGATMTTLRPSVLVPLGYDLATNQDRIPMTTASGVEYVARLPISRIMALGESREAMSVIAHTLPPSATVDGLLGLDFFRGRRLIIDFIRGEITLD